jgi:SAM-dependent methyltransferase
MRAKEWLVVGIVILFVSILLVWLLWEKIAEAIDNRPVARIVEVLKIAPGQKIADVGSGDGPFIFPLAERTGETGVVYAIDINPKALRKVERLVQKRGVGNVRTVLAAEADPKIPEAVDLVLMSSALHHIKDRPAYLRTLRLYLKPVGRIAVIDPIDRWPPFHGRMKYRLDELDGWMQGAGFRRVEKHDFVPHRFFVIYELGQ